MYRWSEQLPKGHMQSASGMWVSNRAPSHRFIDLPSYNYIPIPTLCSRHCFIRSQHVSSRGSPLRAQTQDQAARIPPNVATATSDKLPVPNGTEPTESDAALSQPEQPSGEGHPSPDPPTSGSFGLTAQQLVGLVESGFRGSGRIAMDTATLSCFLRMDLSSGVDPADTALMEERVERFGSNRLPPRTLVTLWELVLDAFKDPTVILLSMAGLLSLVLQLSASSDGSGGTEWIEGASILAAVMIVVGVGSVTNYQKEGKFRELNTLKDDIKIRVVRGGEEQSISIYDLVVGDITLVETGDFIPADGILFDGGPLKVDESHMTGESDDVIKTPTDCRLLLSGSKVLEGFGRMLVLAVGVNSQQGKISTLVNSSPEAAHVGEEDNRDREAEGEGQDPGPAAPAMSLQEGPSPARTAVVARTTAALVAVPQQALDSKGTFLERKLAVLAEQIGNVGMAAAGGVLVINWARYTMQGFDAGNVFDVDRVQVYLNYFITSVTVLVVAIPEGLPLAVTLALAFSVQRMLADNNLVRNLNACETMACATTVCTDKTGTLTQNMMAVVRLWAAGRTFNVRKSRPPSSSSPSPASSSSSSQPPTPSRASGVSPNGSYSSSAAALHMGIEDNLMTRLSLDDVSMLHASSSDASGPKAGLKPSLAMQIRELISANVLLNSTASSKYTAPGVRERSGNRTECALLEFAQGLVLEQDMPTMRLLGIQGLTDVVEVLPFTSERKCMSTLFIHNQALAASQPPGGATSSGDTVTTTSASNMRSVAAGTRLFTKGAAEIILDRCNWQVDNDGHVVPFTEADRRLLVKGSGEKEGLRMMALAYRDFDRSSEMRLDQMEQDLVLVALVGLQDPLRSDVRNAVQQCQRAGLTIRMLTGDNARTAASIASQAGILGADVDVDRMVGSGSALAALARDWRNRRGSSSSSSRMDAMESGTRTSLTSGGTAAVVSSTDPAESPSYTGPSTNLTSSGSMSSMSSMAGTMSLEISSSESSESDGNGSGSGYYGGGARSLVPGAGVAAPSSMGALLPGKSLGPLLAQQALPDVLVLEGQQLRQLVIRADGKLDEQAFRLVWPRLRVLARCSPQDKYFLVTTLKALRIKAEAKRKGEGKGRGRGQRQQAETAGPQGQQGMQAAEVIEVVAMTGDGTNDAPALSAADVGFAMNSGTSIAKDAADILILDDSFSSIVNAVKWGRNVFASITRFLQFQLTANLVAVATACMGAVALQESPLSAVQMLWVNLIMDSLASLSLATEAPTDSMLDQAPCESDQDLVTPSVAKHVLGQAAFQLTALLGLLFYGEDTFGLDHETNNTIIFNAFVMMQLFNQLNCRKVNDEVNIFDGLVQHPTFLVIIGCEAFLQFLIVQYGGEAFQTVPLNLSQWYACLGIGATTLLIRRALLFVHLEEKA